MSSLCLHVSFKPDRLCFFSSLRIFMLSNPQRFGWCIPRQYHIVSPIIRSYASWYRILNFCRTDAYASPQDVHPYEQSQSSSPVAHHKYESTEPQLVNWCIQHTIILERTTGNPTFITPVQRIRKIYLLNLPLILSTSTPTFPFLMPTLHPTLLPTSVQPPITLTTNSFKGIKSFRRFLQLLDTRIPIIQQLANIL